MVIIKKMLVPRNIASKVTSSGVNGRKYITIHETDNTNRGANANAHAMLQLNGNSRSASWHYQVDDKEIIRSFDHTVRCWAGGDGKGNGNFNSIHIEICVNSDGNFTKAKENAQQLVKHIMDVEKIPLSNVVQHNRWSGKNCPRNLRKSGWQDFINGINKKEDVVVSKPSNVVKSLGTAKIKVDSLNLRDKPTLSGSKVIQTLPKGSTWKFYEINADGWVKIGKGWASNKGNKYMDVKIDW